MPDKTQPLGICDHCLGPIKPDEWYTRRGPRRYCSIECRNTGNSREGEPVRHAKLMERIEAGEWKPPQAFMTPDEISARQAKASRTSRLREVKQGRWRNPGTTPRARHINSAKQQVRFTDPAERERISQAHLTRPLADARSNASRFAFLATLWPTNCNAAWCTYDPSANRVTIEPVHYEFTEHERMMPRTGNDLPYAVAPHGERRMAIECRVWLRHHVARRPATSWTCIEHGKTLVFVPIGD